MNQYHLKESNQNRSKPGGGIDFIPNAAISASSSIFFAERNSADFICCSCSRFFAYLNQSKKNFFLRII
jgi:hypothetical protein